MGIMDWLRDIFNPVIEEEEESFESAEKRMEEELEKSYSDTTEDGLNAAFNDLNDDSTDVAEEDIPLDHKMEFDVGEASAEDLLEEGDEDSFYESGVAEEVDIEKSDEHLLNAGITDIKK